ncbi:hypothetical protein [uncultured Psychroserpens sp.]|uniref:hypothetical protein n=1 Tax=uncultured Psychroserpens sp. TaxID=255436 RepID=UPI00260E9DD9|nr:hypothetical protein [uncultured Psychroserpens sp.]
MKQLNITIVLLVLFIFIGCREKVENFNTSTDKKTNEIQSNEISTASKSWLEIVNNKNLIDIRGYYANNAFKVISADSIVTGSSTIAEYYINKSNLITESKTLFLTEANKTQGIDYELINYKTEDLEEYIQVVIWKQNDDKKVREFEYSVKRNKVNSNVDKDDISKRRGLWIELCNKNNAENLVKELYANNAIYFNHKPLVIGTEAISKEYQYMNNNNYNLTLEPLKVEMVTEHIAFEIGQCKGSYGGKYVIVWKKESGEKWKVFIDSNF